MSRWTRFRDSARMSHDWPRRAFQAARHGDRLSDLLRDVPGHRGFTSQLNSLIGNDRFWEFFQQAVPMVIGAGFGAASGVPGVGGWIGSSLKDQGGDQGGDPGPAPGGSDNGNIFGDGLLSQLFSRNQDRQDRQDQNQTIRPYIGGEGLI